MAVKPHLISRPSDYRDMAFKEPRWERQRITVRGDLIFGLDFTHLDREKLRYNICDYFVRVEHGDIVRYGVLVGIPDDADFAQNSYMIEIPTSSSYITHVERAKEQEAIIKDYIDSVKPYLVSM